MTNGELIELLREFTPNEFSEDVFINAPPFIIIEKLDGQDLIVVARNEKCIRIFDKLLSNNKNYMKKLHENVYLIERLNIIDALIKFSWIVRMSWKNEEVYLLWSLLNACLRTSDHDSFKSILMKELDIELEKSLTKLGLNIVEDRNKLLELLMRRLTNQLSIVPPALLQKIIDYLCILGDLTVEELSRRIIREGVSTSTLYKALSRLKKENYVRVVKHVRISNRGPMRELLSSNCGKCLYNYSSHDACYKSSLNQLSAILYAFYDKALTSRDLEKLYIEFRSIPYPQRVVNRINNILISLNVIRSKLEDRLTNSILQRIQSTTGINII